jgi:hypothetical protein
MEWSKRIWGRGGGGLVKYSVVGCLFVCLLDRCSRQITHLRERHTGVLKDADDAKRAAVAMAIADKQSEIESLKAASKAEMEEIRNLHKKLVVAKDQEHARIVAQIQQMHDQELASAQRVKSSASSLKDLIKSVKSSTQEVETLQHKVFPPPIPSFLLPSLPSLPPLPPFPSLFLPCPPLPTSMCLRL